MAENKGFKKLRIEGWRQFGSIEIDLHPRLTIITGANGAGKSTLLSFFTRHFGYNRNLLAIPGSTRGKASFSFGVFDWVRKKTWFTKEQRAATSPQIGEITYSSDIVSPIRLPGSPSLHYAIQVDRQQDVPGIHIDSHRPPNIYRGVGTIPTYPPAIENIGTSLNSEYINYYAAGNISNGSLYHIKMTLIQMSVFGYGNQTMEPIPELIELFRGFEEKLRTILPKSLGFQRLLIRSPEILLSTRSGDFLIDAASGGIIKLFEVAWQIYFFSKSLKNSKQFVVTFDEPENHLHPAMQRSFLPSLMDAFPEVQIIVVTHSPFIISAMRDSHVYVLRYEETDVLGTDDESIRGLMGTKVFAEKLDTMNKAGTASEILRDVLGVTATIPDWAEGRLQEIVSDYQNTPLDKTTLKELYQRLESEGLASSYPIAVLDLTRQN